MNILVVSVYGLYTDLSASFVHHQAAAYAAMGHRIRSLILLPFGKKQGGGRFFPLLRREERDGVELLYVRFPSFSNFGKKRLNPACAKGMLALQWGRVNRGFCPDVIHAHTFGLDEVAGAWLKEKLRCPLVLTTHGETLCEPFWKRNEALIAPRASRADALVCVSSLLKRQMERVGVDSPLQIILNGFSLEHVQPPQAKSGVSLIQAGFLVARKKADVTIQALARLKQHHPDAELVLIGSGAELERFQALAERLDVKDAVSFRGFRPNAEVLAEMAKSRFFVMPSVDEGFGIVYLEAMASGCVTIGTEGEGIADLIVSGENGFLVPPDDPDAIVRVIDWCLRHPEEASAIAERGRAAAVGLTWEKNAEQYIALFSSLLESEKSG